MKPTKEQLLIMATEACERDNNIGLCVECGQEQDGCEPDAERYKCENCGLYSVYGAEQLVLMDGTIQDVE